jgi:putative methyltransferase (TIGR04325 family)
MTILHQMLPSSVRAGIRRLRNGPEFTGDYSSWSAASNAAEGFNVQQLVDKVRSAALKVRNGTAAFERDSVCFYQEEFRWPLLCSLLHVATRNGGRLHVADFGGSLGSVYFQHRKFLADVKDLNWSIVEQREYVTVGQQEFGDDTLQFFSTLDQCAERGEIDVALFSGSLQYLEDPFRFLKRAADLTSCIIIDRTPFIEGEKDRITVQSPPASIYGGSHPHRFFAKQTFERFMNEIGFTAFAEWVGLDHEADIESGYRGRIYRSTRS